jgi:hypothetical protein
LNRQAYFEQILHRVARVGLLLGLLLLCARAADPSTVGLQLSATLLPNERALQLFVRSEEGHPLTSARASRVTVLHAPRLESDLARWTEATGQRTFSEGTLRLDLRWDHENTSSWFFVAREATLPPAVTVSNAAGLRLAVNAAQPGTRILLAPGTYPGGFFFANLQGQSNLPIVIAAADPEHPPVIQGGANGMQLSDPAWVELHNLTFTGATGNGLNIDDGGSFVTPARHLLLRQLRVTEVGPQGNRDGIKLSGVTDFRVEGCLIERWGSSGSGIDMVGCHRGIIESNVFRHTPAAGSTGANGVQTKGGSREVIIRRNRFEHPGARGVNIGGSTGLEFFRPPLEVGSEHAEAKDIQVEGNTFLGSTAPVAFVGVDGAVVRFNTIYRPERWAIRILQETTATGFVPCREGRFTDNLVAFHSTQWSAGGVNLGPHTDPSTFQFARNWWYCIDDPARSRPTLPAAEIEGAYGQPPLFRDADNGDFRLQPESPARQVGAEALPIEIAPARLISAEPSPDERVAGPFRSSPPRPRSVPGSGRLSPR